ncbi:MAG: PAS domain S-box protein [Anaerolineaceae bacterium]|nr:PAS domain S-box protein [Anaerolineaceae bacterium]
MDNSYNGQFDPSLISLLEDAIEFAVYQIAVDRTHPHGGRVIMFSPSLIEIAGIDDPLNFNSWFIDIHPEDKQRVIEANRRSWTEAVRYDQTARHYNKTKGEWTWVRTISTPVFDAEHNLSHFTGLVIDITEQKLAEDELKYRSVFENLILSLATKFINLPPDDLDTAICEALKSIGEFTEVDRSYLFSFSENQETLTCTHEWCAPDISPQIQYLRQIPVSNLQWSNYQIFNGKVLHIPSVSQLPAEAQNEKIEFTRQGIQSLLAVPMEYQGRVIGLLGFDSVLKEKTWPDDSVALLQVVASIIINAQENKRAHESLLRAYDDLEQRVVDRTVELKLANFNLQKEIEQRKQAEESLRISQALYSEVFENSTKQLFIIEVLPDEQFRILRTNPKHQKGSGLTSDQVWGKTIDEVVIPEVAQSIKQHYLDCIKAGHAIEYEEQGPSPYWDLDRIRTFHTTISPVFDQNGKIVRLVGATEDITDQKAAEKIIMEKAREEAVSAERSRLARELHDAVTQTLFSTTLTAEVLPKIFEKNPKTGFEKLGELRELTRGALAEMRTLLMELRPEALADAELVDLLQHLVNAFIARARIPIDLQIKGDCSLPVDVKIGFYRIAQEALNNISKHADPEKVLVSLTCHPETIDLIVDDNGRGFETDRLIGTDHYGLRIMQERAAEINAELEITSQINQGAHIHLRWLKPFSNPVLLDEKDEK